MVASQVYEFHVWQEGVFGTGDSFENLPGGTEQFGHTPRLIDARDIIVEEFGTTGPPENPTLFTTFLVTANLSQYEVEIQPGNEVVFAVVERLNGDAIALRVSGSNIVESQEDVFHETNQAEAPGFLVSQLLQPFASFASRISVEVPVK